MEIAGEHTVEVRADDGPLPVFETWPADPHAAVVVVQEAFGVNDHIAEVARRLAREGYHAIAPQLFHRDGVNALPYDNFDAAKPHMANLTDKGIRIDIEATLDHLAAQGFSPASMGIIGFCMGGSIVVAAASDYALGAAVTFYGGGVVSGRFGFPPLVELAPAFQTPWLGLFGDLDHSIPPDHVELLREAAAKAIVPTTIVRYADAGHGFHCDARPANYHEPSATDAWTKALDWLSRFVQPRP